MLWRQPSTTMKMLEGGGGCLLQRTGTLVQEPAQLLCRNQLHNPHLACAGVAEVVSQQADGHDRHAGTQKGTQAGLAGRLAASNLWTGTESGLAFVEHTAAGPSALNPR